MQGLVLLGDVCFILGAGAVCTTMGFGNTWEWVCSSLYTEPTPYVPPNQNSAQIEVECVTNAVAELLKVH